MPPMEIVLALESFVWYLSTIFKQTVSWGSSSSSSYRVVVLGDLTSLLISLEWPIIVDLFLKATAGQAVYLHVVSAVSQVQLDTPSQNVIM